MFLAQTELSKRFAVPPKPVDKQTLQRSGGGTSERQQSNSYLPWAITEQMRKRHSSVADENAQEEQGYPCPHRDCVDDFGQSKKHFRRKADLHRHHKSAHDVKYVDCPRKSCARKGKNGFTRKDHLVEHLRGYHMEYIPKRRQDPRPFRRSLHSL